MHGRRGAELNPAKQSALDWGFLKRTALASVVTTLLVALFSAYYYSPAWGGRYLVFAVWALVFFSLTGVIFQQLAFSTRRAVGFIYIMAKLAWMAVMFVILMVWPPNTEKGQAEVVAMLLGVSTPLIVLVLRALGFLMEASRKGTLSFPSPALRRPAEKQLDPGNGELKPHS